MSENENNSEEQQRKQQELDEFLRGEAGASPVLPPSYQADSAPKPVGVVASRDSLRIPTESAEGKVRHSIKSCTCEKCQAKRLEIARKFGLVAIQEENTSDLPEIDSEIVGAILTIPHVYMETVNAGVNKDIAAVWRVAEERQQKLGKFGNAVLEKYLSRADFRYKTEVLASAFYLSDLSIRGLNHAKIKALQNAEKKLAEGKP